MSAAEQETLILTAVPGGCFWPAGGIPRGDSGIQASYI